VNQGGRGQRHRRASTGLRALATLLLAVAAGCSRGDATPKGTLVPVRLRDFKLTTKVEKVPAGFVTFRVHNVGPSTHEFVVARTDVAADALPLRGSSLAVNEDSKKLRAVGELGEVRLDATRDLTLNLKAGRYALYCNLEGHYRGGMYAMVEVKA
jgi:uncharacterized cupredoxin-like copper-binding protein